MSEAWGMPPWEVENQAPALWADRWLAYKSAIADAQEIERKKSERR